MINIAYMKSAPSIKLENSSAPAPAAHRQCAYRSWW